MIKNKKLIIALILMLVIGFASVSTTLILTGVVGIGGNKDDFKVIFTKAKLNKTLRNEFIDKETKQTITYETDVLSIVDDTSVLEYEVTNTSRNYDADVTIDLEIPEKDYVYIEFEPKTMFIEAGKSKSGSVTVKLKKMVDEDKTISMRCGFKVNSRKRESLGAEYVEPFSRAGTMMAAKNSKENPESVWKYREYVRKVVFENRMNPHETTEELTFDVSEAQDKSVMAYLVPLSYEEKYALFTEMLNTHYIMNEEELIKYFQEEEGRSLTEAVGWLSELRCDYFVPFTEEEKIYYIDKVLKFETGMTLEELKQYALEQGATEEEFNTNIEEMKKDLFSNYPYSDIDIYTLYIQSDTGIKANTDSSYLFYDFYILTKIEGLDYLDTSNVTNMKGMFSYCTRMVALDLSSFDTSNVTDMSYMFEGEFDAGYNSFKNLNLSSFNTNKVTTMRGMFASCANLDSLDLSSFDTINVIDMSEMFFACYDLKNIDLSNFDTSNVTTMAGMFRLCHGLESINIRSFNTSKVIDMSGMFNQNYRLTSLDLSSFTTESLQKISDGWPREGMFSGSDKLTYLDMSNFDFSAIENKKEIFRRMPDNATIKVKDKAAQDWILALSSNDRPSAWTTSNIVIAS